MSDKMWTVVGVSMWCGFWGWFFWEMFKAVMA